MLAVGAALSLSACQSVPDGALSNFSFFRQARPLLQNEPAVVAEEHFVRGDYGLAERYYREAVERDALDISSWYGLAASYDQLKRFDFADRAYDHVLQLTGETPQYLNNRGYSHLLRGEVFQARALMALARAQDPIDPVIANNLMILKTGRAPF
jgi:Flp pilus assembly protein TadD